MDPPEFRTDPPARDAAGAAPGTHGAAVHGAATFTAGHGVEALAETIRARGWHYQIEEVARSDTPLRHQALVLVGAGSGRAARYASARRARARGRTEAEALEHAFSRLLARQSGSVLPAAEGEEVAL